ncbi:hypothetical protein PYCC9005_002987 [Savitreella phatthalungensis]
MCGCSLIQGVNGHVPVTLNDGDQPAETIGYNLNHTCIRVKDLEESLHFYRDLMGMRSIFYVDSNSFVVYYLGYPKRGHQQTGQEILNERLQKSGLLELIYVKNADDNARFDGNRTVHPYHTGFCHLGFCVPNVPATMRRLKDAGVKVVKDVGELPTGAMYGCTDELAERFANLVRRIAFVADPDGYWCEIVPDGSTTPDAALSREQNPDVAVYKETDTLHLVDGNGTTDLKTGKLVSSDTVGSKPLPK